MYLTSEQINVSCYLLIDIGFVWFSKLHTTVHELDRMQGNMREKKSRQKVAEKMSADEKGNLDKIIDLSRQFTKVMKFYEKKPKKKRSTKRREIENREREDS